MGCERDVRAETRGSRVPCYTYGGDGDQTCTCQHSSKFPSYFPTHPDCTLTLPFHHPFRHHHVYVSPLCGITSSVALPICLPMHMHHQPLVSMTLFFFKCSHYICSQQFTVFSRFFQLPITQSHTQLSPIKTCHIKGNA